MLDVREKNGFAGAISSVFGRLNNENTAIKTEVEVLKGRNLIERVVESLELTKDPEFNPTLQERGLFRDILATIGLVGSPAPLPPEEQKKRDLARSVSNLIENIEVSNTVNSLVFQIHVKTQDADKSVKIADTLAEYYIKDQMQARMDAGQAAIEWLATEISSLQQEYSASQEAVRKFRAETSVINVEALAGLERQLKELRSRLGVLGETEAAQSDKIEALKQARDIKNRAALSEDPTLRDLAAEFERGSPTAAAEFERVYTALLARLDRDLVRDQIQTASLAEVEQKLAAQVTSQWRDLAQLEQLLQTTETNRMLYEQFQIQHKEALARQGAQQPDSRILSAAVRPEYPSAPRKAFSLTLAGMLGFCASVTVVLFRELFNERLRSLAALETIVNAPIFAQVPKIPKMDSRALLHYLARNPTSAAAESIRNLRVSLSLYSAEKAPQVVMLTSSIPGEGKSTLTVALAQNISRLGQRVLVLEADMRLSPFGQYVEGVDPNGAGLASVLQAEIAWQDAVQSVAGVADFIAGASPTINAADLFTGPRFGQILAQLRGVYDVILIDTPPVLAVPDARIISQHADAVVYLVHWDHVTSSQLRAGIEQLRLVNVHPAGFVFYDVDLQKMRSYGADMGGIYGYQSQYYVRELEDS